MWLLAQFVPPRLPLATDPHMHSVSIIPNIAKSPLGAVDAAAADDDDDDDAACGLLHFWNIVRSEFSIGPGAAQQVSKTTCRSIKIVLEEVPVVHFVAAILSIFATSRLSMLLVTSLTLIIADIDDEAIPVGRYRYLR